MPAAGDLRIEVDWGLAYEALIGLSMFIGGEEEHSYDVGPAWFKSVHHKASPELREAGRRLFGKHGFGLVGLGGVVRESAGRTVSALVDRLRKDRTEEPKWAILHCSSVAQRNAIQAGDRQAIEKYLKRMHGKSERDTAMRLIETDAHQIAADVAYLLERWDREIFSQLAPPLEAELKASAQSVSRLARQLPWDRLIIKATRGVEYRREPWIDSVVLVPSVLNRPWVDIADHGTTKFFFYPASAESTVPDLQLVELYKALGDETRLRILRLLSNGESSLTEIAEKLGLAKSTVHGHMRILRIAGLTRSVVGDEGKGYVLNDRPDLNSLLESYLKA
jgi:DNA-binding transcriptional ArsR family regulator